MDHIARYIFNDTTVRRTMCVIAQFRRAACRAIYDTGHTYIARREFKRNKCQLRLLLTAPQLFEDCVFVRTASARNVVHRVVQQNRWTSAPCGQPLHTPFNEVRATH